MGFRESSNRELFARLYDEYLPKVYRYINFKVSDVPLTEDLTSAVFEKALTSFARYSSDKAAFSTWIFSIARNTVIDYYRTNKKNRSVELDEAIEVPVRAMNQAEALEARDEKKRMLAFLAQLPPEDKEIIQLKFAAEMNNREIARLLGMSESNVGTRLFRAVRKLRDKFEGR